MRSFEQLQADLAMAERDLRAAHLEVEAAQQETRRWRGLATAERGEMQRTARGLVASVISVQRSIFGLVIRLETRASAMETSPDRRAELMLFACDLRRVLLDVQVALGAQEEGR